MSKLIEEKIVEFVEFTDLDATPVCDWHDKYIGLKGILRIYESERKAPGKIFIYFYPSEPDYPEQRYFHSSLGILDIENGFLILKTNHIYRFKDSFIPDEDILLLKRNTCFK